MSRGKVSDLRMACTGPQQKIKLSIGDKGLANHRVDNAKRTGVSATHDPERDAIVKARGALSACT
jgi:hypothetical protein